MLCCPFHNDKTPSLQIYAATNTFCCFSSNCKAGTGDVIEFIRLKEQCSKHEAILKAKSLLGVMEPIANTNPAAVTNHPQELTRVAILAKYLESCRNGITKSDRAKRYAEERSLDWEQLKIGFSGEKVPVGWNDHYKQSALQVDLIIKSRDGYGNHFKNCMVFSLENAQGQPVSIYGRNISDDATGKHYYLPGGHQGLYPGYPKPETKRLILTEAIIDAATLHQHTVIVDEYTVLACYGTNGFTTEHEQAIKELRQLEEVVIFFDGDEAGKEGAKKVATKLQEIRKDIMISEVNTPEGEDVNSLAQSHDQNIFAHLLQSRSVIFSIEKKTPSETETTSTASKEQLAALEIQPHLIIYRTTTSKGPYKGTSMHYA